METFKISSSDGVLTVNSQNGQVLTIMGASETSYLKNIKKIDILEYKQFYSVKQLPGDVDILDVSYWYYTYIPYTSYKNCILYEVACKAWREDVIKLRKSA